MAFISTSPQHLDLLLRAASPDFPMKVSRGHGDVDFALYSDLVTDGLVDGRPVRDGMDAILYAHHGITPAGLAELQVIRDKQEQATSIGWIRHNRKWLLQTGIGFILGVLATLASGSLQRLFGW